MDDSGNILYPNEIESYLESLEIFDVSNIGSNRWFLQQNRLFKLCLQASVNVKSNTEGLIKEEVVIQQKVPMLIHELIAVELWRLKILPHLLQMEFVSKSVIPLYTVIYHEITIVSFLEILSFHEDVIESAGDALVDLVDYCYRKIMILKGIDPKDVRNVSERLEEFERFHDLKKKLDFESAIKCVSILSYIAQHKTIIPLSVLHRMLVVHDIPLLFTELLCDPPWVREMDAQTERYEDSIWKKVSPAELIRLTKVEAQLWISLMQLLLHPECQKKYDMSGFRKDQILKLRSKLNETLMDQIPVLHEMLRYLEQLSFFDAPVPKSGIVIEQVPEIWESIRASKKGKWREIAEKQSKEYFLLSDTEIQEFCKRTGDCFDVKNIEAMLSDSPVCANCHEKGGKRCSRCRNEWYCCRSCQVSHWTKHKPACDSIAAEM